MLRTPSLHSDTLAASDRRGSHGLRHRAVALFAATIIGSMASPALASSETRTRVIRCGVESCLLVRGHRDDPTASVRINGRAVSVAGDQDWRAIVPVETVRRWSAPHAREIEVSLDEGDGQLGAGDTVDLPIGLLSCLTDLAVLEVSTR